MRSLKNIFVVLALIAGVNCLNASSVSLSWNPSTNSSVAGYKIYFGTASQSYFTNVVTGNTTNATVTGLTNGVTYYFAATSYDTAGNESGYSDEAVATVPTASGATLSAPSPAGNGRFSFGVTGTAGAQYVVQASSDMVNWVILETNTAPFTVTDTNAGAFASRFYRAVSLY